MYSMSLPPLHLSLLPFPQLHLSKTFVVNIQQGYVPPMHVRTPGVITPTEVSCTVSNVHTKLKLNQSLHLKPPVNF
jgi:hypothetical protein